MKTCIKLLSFCFLFSPKGKLFLEVLVANSFSKEALEWLSSKKKNCRVMLAKQDAIEEQKRQIEGGLVIRSVYGGLLVQTPDETGTSNLNQEQ